MRNEGPASCGPTAPSPTDVERVHRIRDHSDGWEHDLDAIMAAGDSAMRAALLPYSLSDADAQDVIDRVIRGFAEVAESHDETERRRFAGGWEEDREPLSAYLSVSCRDTFVHERIEEKREGWRELRARWFVENYARILEVAKRLPYVRRLQNGENIDARAHGFVAWLIADGWANEGLAPKWTPGRLTLEQSIVRSLKERSQSWFVRALRDTSRTGSPLDPDGFATKPPRDPTPPAPTARAIVRGALLARFKTPKKFTAIDELIVLLLWPLVDRRHPVLARVCEHVMRLVGDEVRITRIHGQRQNELADEILDLRRQIDNSEGRIDRLENEDPHCGHVLEFRRKLDRLTRSLRTMRRELERLEQRQMFAPLEWIQLSELLLFPPSQQAMWKRVQRAREEITSMVRAFLSNERVDWFDVRPRPATRARREDESNAARRNGGNHEESEDLS